MNGEAHGLRVPVWGSLNKDYNNLGSILGSPLFWETTKWTKNMEDEMETGALEGLMRMITNIIYLDSLYSYE